MLSRRYLLPFLAVAGVVIAIVAVIRENRPVPPTAPAVQPAAASFASFVAGTATVEPSSGNIALGTPVPGIVKVVFVKWGDRVREGEPLFQIDDRDLRAKLPPAQASTKEAAARLEQARGRLRIAESVTDRRAVSLEELENRRSEVAVASAVLEGAKARMGEIKEEMGRRIVRAPLSGRILRLEVRPGEYAASGASGTPLMVLGDDRRLHVRVDVDEYDAWRVQPGAPAVASPRGNPGQRAALRFVRVEPSLVPKSSLTGISTERVDTRVLQVIYSLDPAALPHIYIGQQMDVFIQVPPDSGAPRGVKP